MEEKSSSLTRQVQMWAVLGPLIIAVTLIIAKVRVSPSGAWLPLLTVMATPACIRWGFRAMVMALIVLAVTALLSFSSLSVEDRFWHVGLTMALALGLVITTLCYEEVGSLVNKMHRESKSRLENLLRMDAKLRHTQDEWFHDKEDLIADNRQFKRELEEKGSIIQRYEKMLPSLQEEMDAHDVQREDLLKELYEVRLENGKQREGAEVAEAKLRDLQALYEQKKSTRETQLNEAIQALEKEVSDLKEARKAEAGLWASRHRQTLSLLEEEKRRNSFLKDAQHQLKEAATAARQRWLATVHRLNKARCTLFQSELARQQPALAKPSPFSTSMADLFNELETLRKTVNRWQGMYKQLRDQFRDKSQTLDDARAQLFNAENERLRLEKELSERDLVNQPEMLEALQKYLVNTEAELASREEEAEDQQSVYEEVITGLLDELAANVK